MRETSRWVYLHLLTHRNASVFPLETAGDLWRRVHLPIELSQEERGIGRLHPADPVLVSQAVHLRTDIAIVDCLDCAGGLR